LVGLDVKTIIGYIITVLVSIVGWSLAIWQFSKQYRRSLKLSNVQKKRDIEVETAREIIPVIMDYNKKSSDILVALIMLKEGLNLRSQRTEFTDHYFDGILNKLTERYYDFWFAYCEVLNFYDYRQRILFNFNETIKDLHGLSETVKESNEHVYEGIKALYRNEFLNKEDFPTTRVADLIEGIDQLRNEIHELDIAIANFCISMQNEFLSEIFVYDTESKA
jgi:hypothetical protein